MTTEQNIPLVSEKVIIEKGELCLVFYYSKPKTCGGSKQACTPPSPPPQKKNKKHTHTKQQTKKIKTKQQKKGKKTIKTTATTTTTTTHTHTHNNNNNNNNNQTSCPSSQLASTDLLWATCACFFQYSGDAAQSARLLYRLANSYCELNYLFSQYLSRNGTGRILPRSF